MNSIEAGSTLIFLAACTTLVAVSCSSTQAKQDAASAAYAADMQKCVADAPTKASADACREGVRQQWAKDGGK